MVFTGDEALRLGYGGRPRQTATTFKEGNRRANYRILTQEVVRYARSRARTGWLTDSASCRLGVSMTVSTKSAAFRETAAGLESPSWKTLGFATRSLNRLLAVELLPTPDVPARAETEFQQVDSCMTRSGTYCSSIYTSRSAAA